MAQTASGEGGSTSSETHEQTQNDNFASKKETKTRTGAGKPTVLSATVRFPRSHFVQLVRGSAQRGAPAASARGRSAHPTASAPTRASDGPVRGGEGVVTRYDAERGFGFIAPDAGGADLFVHVSVVRGADALQEGDRVRYKVRQSDRGPQADSVELV